MSLYPLEAGDFVADDESVPTVLGTDDDSSGWQVAGSRHGKGGESVKTGQGKAKVKALKQPQHHIVGDVPMPAPSSTKKKSRKSKAKISPAASASSGGSAAAATARSDAKPGAASPPVIDVDKVLREHALGTRFDALPAQEELARQKQIAWERARHEEKMRLQKKKEKKQQQKGNSGDATSDAAAAARVAPSDHVSASVSSATAPIAPPAVAAAAVAASPAADAAASTEPPPAATAAPPQPPTPTPVPALDHRTTLPHSAAPPAGPPAALPAVPPPGPPGFTPLAAVPPALLEQALRLLQLQAVAPPLPGTFPIPTGFPYPSYPYFAAPAAAAGPTATDSAVWHGLTPQQRETLHRLQRARVEASSGSAADAAAAPSHGATASVTGPPSSSPPPPPPPPPPPSQPAQQQQQQQQQSRRGPERPAAPPGVGIVAPARGAWRRAKDSTRQPPAPPGTVAVDAASAPVEPAYTPTRPDAYVVPARRR